MSKGLEELSYIKENHLQLAKEKYRKLEPKALEEILTKKAKRYDIIEKELKEYQEIKVYMQQYEIENVEELRRILHNDWVIRQKFKMDTAYIFTALEIINKKEVDVALLKLSKNVERYNVQIEPTHLTIQYYVLTQEEFDLLKEVLL